MHGKALKCLLLTGSLRNTLDLIFFYPTLQIYVLFLEREFAAAW
jgi:hypothetical protein